MATANQLPGGRTPLEDPNFPNDQFQACAATLVGTKTSSKHRRGSNSDASPESPPLPPTVYGELSILGYNGYIPSVERNGRKNKSKFLLCKRPTPNGIQKSRHYFVKQPQATKAIQDKDLHSISYTFSRAQTIIVEYAQDENTDMFQIGRSTEEPIDFVVMDTLTVNTAHQSSSNHHSSNRNYQPNENSSSSRQISGDEHLLGLNRYHRHMAKVGEQLVEHYVNPPPAHDPRNRLQYYRNQAAQAVLLNYPQPNMSNLPPMMADHFRNQSSLYHQNHHHHHLHHGHSSGVHAAQQMISSNHPGVHGLSNSVHDQHEHCSSKQNVVCSGKRSHATQSTISRFACRILVDRNPPYTARIYAAGFDSSRNIFLGEKATKWGQNNTIDGLTTNGVLLMHPKRGSFFEDSDETVNREAGGRTNPPTPTRGMDGQDSNMNLGDTDERAKQFCSTTGPGGDVSHDETNNSTTNSSKNKSSEQSSMDSPLGKANNIQDSSQPAVGSLDYPAAPVSTSNDSNNNSNDRTAQDSRVLQSHETGGVWREVSVDGGIYAIRESRSASQKGMRIEDETNILQDGTLIDLCGATLLWRSVDGFKTAPTKKSLEEKIDMLNASRPQCPVGLNTLVIPRKPILPSSHHHHHHHHHHHRGHHKDQHSSKGHERNSHQPYVYIKCGHVQGYHDWGATEKVNQRTCPICLSVGMVAKLSMGLEPSFYVDSGPLTHAFNPCGHMASERTVKYWCSIKIPHGTHFFHSICPFCATPLTTTDPAFTRLIFQDDLD